MSLHQIIYTSCKRGIDGVNDGQQVYSYDSGLTAQEKEEVKPLFTYTQPRLPDGQEMTDEVARTMPQSFEYCRFASGDCAVSLNTYLGRDYMGEGGRFGNHLAHVILTNDADFTLYPCEMIQSPALRSSMTYEEVNDAQKPAFLSTPMLVPGDVVTLDAVIEFLQDDEDHMFFYKRMVDAMLRIQKENKRLVICDTPDNLNLWIGALNYTLPQTLAKQIGFTTYSADPSLSRARICGVLPEGTRYIPDAYCNSGQFFVFDFIHQMASPDEYASSAFLDFLDIAFSFSIESLQKFHTFLMNNTAYRGTDTSFYQGYDLYRMVTQGISDLSEAEFKGAVVFAEQYCNQKMALKICSNILGVRSQIGSFDNTYVMEMFHFLLNHYKEMEAERQEQTKDMIIDQILNLLRDASIQQDEYEKFYSSIEEMTQSLGVSIPATLISGDRKAELEQILYGQNPTWKIYQIVGIFCEYIKASALSAKTMTRDDNPGSIFYSVIAACYAVSPAKGEEAAQKIMSFFADDSRYFTYAALVVEDDLQRLEAPAEIINQIWTYFDETASSYQGKDAENTEARLITNKKYGNVYLLYLHRLDQAQTIQEKEAIFKNLLNETFRKYPDYKEEYYATAVKDYIDRVEACPTEDEEDEDQKNAIFRRLAHLCIKDQLDSFITNKALHHVLSSIPLYKQSQADIRFVRDAINYELQTAQRPIEGRLLLLYTWNTLDRYDKTEKIQSFINAIHEVADQNSINIGLLEDERERKRFVKRIIAWPSRFRPVSDTLIEYYDLFSMPTDVHKDFFDEIRKSYSQKNKGSIDCEVYADYLRLLEARGDTNDIEEAGNSLSGLKQEQLDQMGKKLHRMLRGETQTYRCWQEVLDTAESTGSLDHVVHTIGNVLNKFKKN